jgi:hypothetical protein
MVNFRVANLDAMVAQLSALGARATGVDFSAAVVKNAASMVAAANFHVSRAGRVWLTRSVLV